MIAVVTISGTDQLAELNMHLFACFSNVGPSAITVINLTIENKTYFGS
jgi:hypothetical protein